MVTTTQEEKELTAGQQRVIEAYKVLIEQNGWTLREASRPLQIAASTLSQTLAGKYRGDVAAIVSRMSKALHRERRRKGAPKRPPFMVTSVADDVLKVCEEAHALRLPVLITGPSGIGRTVALKEYCRREPETIYVEAGPFARPKALLQQVAAQVRGEFTGGIHTMRVELGTALQDADQLLIVDEVDYVPEYSLQTLRMIADRANCGIVYCATRAFLEKLRRKRSKTIDQFLNRVAYVHDCEQLTDEDLERLLAFYGLSDRCRDLAKLMASGCARRLVNGVLLALRAAGKRTVSDEMIRRAFKRLLNA